MSLFLYDFGEMSNVWNVDTLIYVGMHEEIHHKVDYSVVFQFVFRVLFYNSSHFDPDARVVLASVVFRTQMRRNFVDPAAHFV